MIWSHLIAAICLLMFLAGYQNVDAQQQLPFGAKAQLGTNKGRNKRYSVHNPMALKSQSQVASVFGFMIRLQVLKPLCPPATPFDVSAIAFSPDGKTLATGSEEGTIWMRRMDIGAIRYFPPVHKQAVLSVTFSPDGKTLASGSRDGTIGLWDIETGKLHRSLAGHTDAVNIVAVFAGWQDARHCCQPYNTHR